ncbi:headcase protein [Anopheles ziemanni]|uniref:headcase protein n=1 Tax=Anopheles coustani TaxID=139045 RepID=UPI0026580F4B|nr:headcase protein [Anopheles coustani]XP_058169792.1 headcase protein [Anopheles ziemanni]
MAPRRSVGGGGSVAVGGGQVQSQQQLHQQTTASLVANTGSSLYDPFGWGGASGDSDHGFESSHSADGSGSEGANMTRCCVPVGECLKPKTGNLLADFGAMINVEDLRDCVRVLCSNDSCTVGQYMHRECFEHWEDEILGYLKSIGRARSWSDKQRQQNLWTKKGYDLVYKMCGCKCGRGHLKKDLDWNAPTTASMFGRALVGSGGGGGVGGAGNGGNSLGPIGSGEDESMKKKKKKNRHNQKPAAALLAISTNANLGSTTSSANSSATNSPNNQMQMVQQQQHHLHQQQQQHGGPNHQQQPAGGVTTNALSVLSNLKISDHFATCLQLSGINPNGLINNHVIAMSTAAAVATARLRANSLSSISNGSSTPPASASSIGGSEQSISPIHNQPPSPASIAKLPLTPKSKVELYSERVRATSGANGIFSRRLDFSSFNVLPRQRINSYSIKIEDEGNHGNDETRLFILSSLAAQHKCRVACVLCEEPMLVFDRYPLVDGTFFLSPKQHAKGCIEVKYENRVQYLTSVCLKCLQGVEPNRTVRCRFCVKKWDGSSLVLGTMYTYDIFAAMPCCTERLKCNTCFKLLLHPNQRLNFYSDYSRSVPCPYCTAQDNHFVKPLSYCYTKQPHQLFQQCGFAPDASGRQEQQSPFNGSSASCATSTIAASVAERAAVDSAAMNSFIQELRLLSNSSTISSISSTSTDSGFSTSYCGDSNVGSGLAPANTLANSNNFDLQQLQFHLPMSGTSNIHQQTSSKQLGPAGSSVLPAAVWGNKSLWGPAPPPSPPTATAITSALVSPAAAAAPMKSPPVLPSVASKELYSPWTTPTASAGSVQSPLGMNNVYHHLPAPIITSSQMLTPPSPLVSSNTSTIPSKPSSSLHGNNDTGNIWESKLGLIDAQQQHGLVEPFGSIWQATGDASVTNPQQTSITGNGNNDHGAWQCDVPSSGSKAMPSAAAAAAARSQFVRPQDTLCDGLAIDTTPKLSSLWTATPWSTAGSVTETSGGSSSVLRSLRMGSSPVKPSGNDAGHCVSQNDFVGGGFASGGTTTAMPTNNSSSMAMFSEEVTSYWSMFN